MVYISRRQEVCWRPFGGRLPRLLQGKSSWSPWERAVFRKEYSRIYTATSHISWSNFRHRRL